MRRSLILLGWYFLVWRAVDDWVPPPHQYVQEVGPFDDRPSCEGQRDGLKPYPVSILRRSESCFWRAK